MSKRNGFKLDTPKRNYRVACPWCGDPMAYHSELCRDCRLEANRLAAMLRAGERRCEICGGRRTRKAKRFCSRTCQGAWLKLERQRENNPMWKGEAAKKGAKNARARYWFEAFGCEVCEKEPAERHHIDGNPGNNEPDNIAILCRRHHMEADGRLIRRGEDGKFVSAA